MATLEDIMTAIQAANQALEAGMAAQIEALLTEIGSIRKYNSRWMFSKVQVIALQDRIPT